MNLPQTTCPLTTVLLAFTLTPFLSLPCQANLLLNPSFEDVGPDGNGTNFNGIGGGGNSSADRWTVFNNSQATTATDLVSSTLSGGGDNMMLVVTDGAQNGIAQVFGSINTGPDQVIASAWVFVNSGQVRLGTGNGGNTGADVLSTTTGQWELLQAPNGVSPANTIAIYSSLAGPANFFVDLASVEIVPEPTSAMLLAAGGLVLLGRRHRRPRDCQQRLGSPGGRRALNRVPSSG